MQTASARRAPWGAVVGLSIDQLVAWGTLYYSYSVLAVPIARDLGVSTSTVAAAFSISLLVSSLLARRVGQVMDRDGARPILLYGSLFAVLALAGLATVQRAVPLFLGFAGLGVAQAFCLYEPAFRAVVEWFPVARQRGRALLVLTAVAGFASTIFLPLSAFLLDRFGWRTAVLLLAVLLAGVSLPVRLRLPRASPRSPQHESLSTFVESATSVRLLGAGFALQSFAATGATVCLVWHLVERGETLGVAAALAGLAGAAQVPGRLLLSPLSNALPTEVRLPSLLAVQGGALLGIAVLTGPALVVAVMTFGASAGVMTLERAAVVIEWFGRDSFGARSGQLASSSLFARATAPFVIELARGSFGYVRALVGLTACLLLGSALLIGATRARRRTQPEQHRQKLQTTALPS
jgi:MFS family permease